MEFSKQNFTKDKQTAHFIYNKFFCSFKNLQDELIQVACIKLWEFRQKSNRYYTIRGANKIAKDAMIDFLRKESKHLDNDSLFGELEEDLLLIDTVAAEQDTSDEKLQRYLKLIDQVRRQLFWLGGKQKRIIELYLNRRSYQEIADCVGISKQNVGECVKAFRKSIAQKLELNIEGCDHAA